MVRSATLILAVALVGCADRSPSGDKLIQAASDRYDAKQRGDNPAGRYQIVQGVNPASVAVLDTRYGTVQNCTLVDSRYHCLAQDTSAKTQGGLRR